jgi:hypothetical protein
VHHRLSSPQPVDQPSAHAERCEACDVVRSGVPCGVGTSLAGAEATVDSDVVVIRGPHITGLLVIPCQHVGGLEELLPPARAHVLAAIRRAVTAVAAAECPSPARVLVSTESPASSTHLCFHVVPPDPAAS